jgi:hypothetical protein
MELIRFYSSDSVALELIAKYRDDKDRGLKEVKRHCRNLMNGIRGCDGDPFDFLNKRIVELDSELSEEEYARMPTATAEDLDARCKQTFDIVIFPEEKYIRIITFRIMPFNDEPGYRKEKHDDITLGRLVT